MTTQSQRRHNRRTFVAVVVGIVMVGSVLLVFRTSSFLSLIQEEQSLREEVVLLEEERRGAGAHNNKSPKDIRLLCFIMLSTEEEYTTRASQVMDAWGKRCDTFLWFGWKNETFRDLPKNHIAVVTKEQDTTYELSRKAHRAWSYVCRTQQAQHYDYDFYMKADLDTYMLMDNYFVFASRLDPSIPHYFGKQLVQMIPKPYPPFVAGASVTLSRAALQRMCTRMLDPSKQNTTTPILYNEAHNDNNTMCTEPIWTNSFGHGDDLALGRCLQSVGITSLDTRDDENRERFMNLPMKWYDVHPTIEDTDPNSWYRKMSFNRKRGPGCCSPEAIAFHYMEPARMKEKLVFQDGVWKYAK